MHRLKSIKLYFFSVLKLFFLSFRNYYFKSNFYNKKLVTLIPTRIFYNPSSYLAASLISTSSDFYEITNISPELLWKTDSKNKLKFENLHSFLWLTKIDRKKSKIFTKNIISSWIDNFYNYEPRVWNIEITSKRIISWTSNTDITLEDSNKTYKEKFLKSLVKQSNFLIKNQASLPYDPSKIICCAAIILSGIIFKETELNFKFGIRELEKIVNIYFDKSGFPKTRNPEEVFICIKYLILIREWLREAQISVPEFLNEIILKCGNCYSFLSTAHKKSPLFNGATEIDYKDYDNFLKTLKYKFNNEDFQISDLIKIKKKKFVFFMDCGNPPTNNFIRNYQAGCLSMELISGKKKIICNSGFGKYSSSKFTSLSRSTAAHSTLYLNDTSSCIFQKNKIINKIYGNTLIEKHKIIEKNYEEDKNSYNLTASHNGYEKKLGYIHTRSISILKKKDKILGQDKLKKTKIFSNSVLYSIRFHVYPDTKVVKTKGGNSVLISLTNGDGWLLQSGTNNIQIEKDLFFGNKSKIVNNESIFISGSTKGNEVLVEWSIERVN